MDPKGYDTQTMAMWHGVCLMRLDMLMKGTCHRFACPVQDQ